MHLSVFPAAAALSPRESFVYKSSPQVMPDCSFSSDLIRDEPWAAEHILPDTNLEPAALLYRSCLGQPFPAGAVCKVGNAEILVMGSFRDALNQIEEVWAEEEDLDKPLAAVELRGKLRTGTPPLRSILSALSFTQV